MIFQTMPPRSAPAEAPNTVLEQPRRLELVSKAMEDGGIKAVLDTASHEADDAISGIHKLGTFDASETYTGSAEDVLKMRTANEDAAKQVQEAKHTLELDLSEFGEATVETPKPVEAPAVSSAIEKPSAPAPVVESVKVEEPPKSEVQQALEETHAMISEKSGINPMMEAQKTEEAGKQFDTMMEDTEPMAEEMARLTETEKEWAKEQKALNDFVSGHAMAMTPLEQKYADSMTAHIAYLAASMELSKAVIGKKTPEEIAKLQEQTKTASELAAKLSGEYEKDLAQYMKGDLDKPAETEIAPKAAAIKPAETAQPGRKIIGADYPLPKGGDELKPKEGFFGKLSKKFVDSIAFWRIKL